MDEDIVKNNNSTIDKEFNLNLDVNKFEYHVRKDLVNNVPAIHRDVRNKVLDEAYYLLCSIYQATYNKGNIRSKYLNDSLVHICILDHYFKTLVELKCVNMKKYDSLVRDLNNIRSRIYGWKRKTDDDIKERKK